MSAVDGSIWASTPDFTARQYKAFVTTEEGEEKEADINEQTLLTKYIKTGQKPPEGLRMNQKKYMVLRTEPEPLTIYGKQGALLNCCVTKTNHVVIFGTCDKTKGHDAGGLNTAIEKIADYLRLHGY